MQIDLLDRRAWATRVELANAIFEWIEAFYHPRRRHFAISAMARARSSPAMRPVHRAERVNGPATTGGEEGWGTGVR
ncbi:transposase InsO family protein [Demequina lutea]|uniref:Transposase InsO family protein n=1 Tax=Demequina lutea TaxID=431489 RepID=A0A7Y9Z8R4_9MICO|nr:transposase InsO family protein [Demequina lutea]